MSKYNYEIGAGKRWAHNEDEVATESAYAKMLANESAEKEEKVKLLKEEILNEKESKFEELNENVINSINTLVSFISENAKCSKELEEDVETISQDLLKFSKSAIELIKKG